MAFSKPCKELRMQNRKTKNSENGPKLRKARTQVVPKTQLRPHMLRKATRFSRHSSLLRICLKTKYSITRPENTKATRMVIVVK